MSGGQIYDNAGARVTHKGVNWFGFETETRVVHGLWARNWMNSIDYGRNADLQGLNSLLVLDKPVAELDRRGMYFLIDHHRPDCNDEPPGARAPRLRARRVRAELLQRKQLPEQHAGDLERALRPVREQGYAKAIGETGGKYGAPAPAPGVSTSVVKTNDWGGGYCANVNVAKGASTAQTWRVNVTIEGAVYTLWNAVWQQSGATLTASGVSWNATLAPQATAQFGYCANR